VCTTVAASYVAADSQSAGAAAEQAAERKTLLNMLNYLQPTNFSQWQLRHTGLWARLRLLLSLTWGVRSRNTRATRLTVITFFQRVSVLIQCYNSILFHETFPPEDEIDTAIPAWF